MDVRPSRLRDKSVPRFRTCVHPILSRKERPQHVPSTLATASHLYSHSFLLAVLGARSLSCCLYSASSWYQLPCQERCVLVVASLRHDTFFLSTRPTVLVDTKSYLDKLFMSTSYDISAVWMNLIPEWNFYSPSKLFHQRQLSIGSRQPRKPPNIPMFCFYYNDHYVSCSASVCQPTNDTPSSRFPQREAFLYPLL